MIRYLLDTNIVSQAGKRRPSANVAAWLATVNDRELAISAITVRERWEGVERARRAGALHAADIHADVLDMVAAFHDRILPVDEEVARHWAALLVPDPSKVDDKCQIAIAAVHGLALVSLNVKDLTGRGVPVLDPGRRPPKLYPP